MRKPPHRITGGLLFLPPPLLLQLLCVALCLCPASGLPFPEKHAGQLIPVGKKPRVTNAPQNYQQHYNLHHNSMFHKRYKRIPDPAPFWKPTEPLPKLQAKWMPLRWTFKFLKVYVCGIVSFLFLFKVNVLSNLVFLVIKPWMKRVRVERCSHSGFSTAHVTTPLVDLAFDVGRTLTYVTNVLAADDRLTSYRWKMRSTEEMFGKPQIPSDDVFISQIMLRTSLAFHLSNTDEMLICNMDALNDVVKFPGTYYEVYRIEVDKKTAEIRIYTRSSGPVSRATHSPADFDKAKLHALQSICFFLPSVGHSWTQFLFADAVAAATHNGVVSRQNVLYRLLEPHTRYTSRTNRDALGSGGSSSGYGPVELASSSLVRFVAPATTTAPRGYGREQKAPGWATRLHAPYTAFSVSSVEFARKVGERATEYYFGREFSCPPKWLQGRNSEIPYLKSLKRFYPIIRDHVQRVMNFQNDPSVITDFVAEVDRLAAVDGYSLRLNRFDPIDVIATFIFQATIVHSTGRFFYTERLCRSNFGIGTLRNPFWRTWFPGRRVPDDLMDGEDRTRWFGFCHVFCDYHDNWFFSNSMKFLDYTFWERELRFAGQDLVAELLAEQERMEEDGDIFCPIEKMARSICF